MATLRSGLQVDANFKKIKMKALKPSEERIMKKKILALTVGAVMVSASTGVLANCDPGEIVIKFSHVTNTD